MWGQVDKVPAREKSFTFLKLAVLANFFLAREIEFSLAMRSHWKVETWLLPPSKTDAAGFQDLGLCVPCRWRTSSLAPVLISRTLEHRLVLDTTCSADFLRLPEESNIVDKDEVVCNGCHVAGASHRPFRQTNRTGHIVSELRKPELGLAPIIRHCATNF